MLQLVLVRPKVEKTSWGFTVVVATGQAVIGGVQPGSIALRSGLRADHIIFQIDGFGVAGMTQKDILSSLDDVSAATELLLRVRLPREFTRTRNTLFLATDGAEPIPSLLVVDQSIG